MSPDTVHKRLDGSLSSMRQVVVRLNQSQPHNSAYIQGNCNVTQLASGQPVAIGIGLSEAVFGFCPTAHVAAFLSAAEAAMGQSVDSAHIEARAYAVLSEALATCVWRHAIDWPKLAHQAPDLELTKQARQLAANYRNQLFSDNWRQFGGCAMAATAQQSALYELANLTRRAMDNSKAHLEACPRHDMRPTKAGQETALAIMYDSDYARPLRDWFEAQLIYADQLCLATKDLDALAINGKRRVAGMALTGRGRLFHHLYMHDGKISDWTVTAPTDVNFAPNGAAAQQMAEISDPELAKWIVAAFDPCMPVQYLSETDNA